METTLENYPYLELSFNEVSWGSEAYLDCKDSDLLILNEIINDLKILQSPENCEPNINKLNRNGKFFIDYGTELVEVLKIHTKYFKIEKDKEQGILIQPNKTYLRLCLSNGTIFSEFKV